jgi:transposase-like protein
MERLPETLQEAIQFFTDPEIATEFVRDIRWPDGVECPTCGSKEVTYLKNQRRWKCKTNHPKQQFSVKVGTIFEDSPIGLDKWLPAAWLVTTCKNGISSYELSRDLKVTQKTAWFILHRVRVAMRVRSFEKLSGECEADETFVGGKIRNMHKHSKRKLKAVNDGNWGKTVVLGLMQRDGHVRATVAPNRKTRHIRGHVLENVELGSSLYTDEADVYQHFQGEFVHEFVNHLSDYVKGRVHINGLENFWSLLKRTLGGTYVSVDPIHLFRYLDEQCFRYNFRKLTDQNKFMIVIAHVIGQRLTYAELTGKVETETSQS